MRGVFTKGAWIRELRKSRGFTQEKLAALSDCDVKTLRKAERGLEPVDLRVVVEIAHGLGTPAADLIESDAGFSVLQERHLESIRQWLEAYHRSDIAALLSLHTEDTILEIPGTDGLPSARTCRGIDQLRKHFEEFFSVFQLTSYRTDDLKIHAVDSMAFLCATATFEYLPLGKSYTTRHVCEFEFRDEKIAHRVTVADYDDLRRLLEEDTPDSPTPSLLNS